MGWFRKKKDPPDANEMLRLYNEQEAARLAAAGIGQTDAVIAAPGTLASVVRVAEFAVDDVFSITGRGQVATGRTTIGVLYVGDTVVVLRGGVETGAATITGIEMFRKKATEAPVGTSAGLLLKPSVDVARGDVIRTARTT